MKRVGVECHISKEGGGKGGRNKTSNKTSSMDVTSERNSKYVTINDGTGGTFPITISIF